MNASLSTTFLFVFVCLLAQNLCDGDTNQGPPECDFDVTSPEFEYSVDSDQQQYQSKYGYYANGPKYRKKMVWTNVQQQVQQIQQFQNVAPTTTTEKPDGDESEEEAPEPEVLPVWKLTMPRNAEVLSCSRVDAGAQTSYFFVGGEDFQNANLTIYSKMKYYKKTVDVTAKSIDPGWYVICGQYRFIKDSEKALCNRCHMVQACTSSSYDCASHFITTSLLKRSQTAKSAKVAVFMGDFPFETAVVRTTVYQSPDERRCETETYEEGMAAKEATVLPETQTVIELDGLRPDKQYTVTTDVVVRLEGVPKNITLNNAASPFVIQQCRDRDLLKGLRAFTNGGLPVFLSAP